MHERQLHDEAYFLTLTYKTNPRTLDHNDFQRFMKRYRKTHAKWDDKHQQMTPRYFMCGEYGDVTKRPHYHAAILGHRPKDLVLYSKARGHELYTSKTIDELWGHGECKIGELTYESAAYIASYVTKKVTGEKAKDHYERIDIETGELYQLEPEYAQMSRRPGIAARWIEKYETDVFNYDHVIQNGRPQRPPRYYDKYLEKQKPARLEELKKQRAKTAQATKGENEPHRLKVRETITRARMNLKQRTL